LRQHPVQIDRSERCLRLTLSREFSHALHCSGGIVDRLLDGRRPLISRRLECALRDPKERECGDSSGAHGHECVAVQRTVPTGRSTQLWLIPAGRAPISVGVFAPDTTNVLPLSPELLTQLGPAAALAVSIEPLGGSPTGQPTGPVVAKGAIISASARASAG
jgi:hypothetical protein